VSFYINIKDPILYNPESKMFLENVGVIISKEYIFRAFLSRETELKIIFSGLLLNSLRRKK